MAIASITPYAHTAYGMCARILPVCRRLRTGNMARPATSNKPPAKNAVFLGKILSSFDGPLNEEQAWAVCYQSAHFLKMSWLEYDKSSGLSLVDGADAICVHKDGSITISVREVQSLRGKGEENSADLTGDHIYHTESEVVNALGRIIYHALDYGCHEEEERVLSEPLEDMIDQMTNSGEGTVLVTVDEEDRKSQGSANTDEGIVDGQESDEADERNNTSYRRLSTFADVLKVCSEHLLEPEGAPMHYQAVCRALLAEAVDLTSFLQVIASSKQSLQSLHNDHRDMEDSYLEDIQPKQWARIWMQVLQQLRQVVKLKDINDTSLNQSRIPIEYELTPYEILMDDIRSRKYTLRQVLVNDDLPPRVKKEAHDVILDFIRSRPPLKPVPKGYSQPQRAQTLYERMLSDIRSKPCLAPAANRVLPERKPKLKKKKTNRNRPKMRHQSTSEGSCASSVDSEDLDIFDSPEFPRKVLRAGITLDWSDEDDAIETDATLTVTPRTDNDITPQPTCMRNQLKPFKRLETLNAPSFESLLSPDSSVTPTNEEDETRFHDVDSEAGGGDNEQLPTGESPRRHSVTVCQTLSHYSSHPERYIPPECLALTVDEVIHIRSVLVKAEIENLRVNPKIHTAVLKEKICFSCKKKFALFKRKSRCKLCKRLICTICTKQMFLPRGHFLQIPIESLSPISPKRSQCFGGHQPSQLYKSHSEPPTPSVSPQGSPILWRREKQTNRPKEQLDKVCCECKDFLKEAVRASREASYINGSGHRESDDFRLNSPPRLPKQSSQDSERSDRSTRSTASNRSKRSDRDLHRQGSRHGDIECDAPSTQGDEHD